MILNFISKFRNPNIVKLHGYDMSVWDYLGYSTIHFGDYEPKCMIHFFQKKGDANMRDYCLETISHRTFMEHPWMSNVHLWKGLQIGLFTIVKTWPSAFTREHYAKKSLFWNDTKREWIFKDINSENVVSLFKK